MLHEAGLREAAADGELWKIRVTSVPEPNQTRKYIEDALTMQKEGKRLPYAVIDAATGDYWGLVATTTYYQLSNAWKLATPGTPKVCSAAM